MEAFSVSTKAELKDTIEKVKSLSGPVLVEVKIKNGARKDLGRPKSSTQENKHKFMEFLTL